MKNTFKILSIDGGGIKGIYSIALLDKLETLTGEKIVESFDLICGTSTGGLIALFLGAGYTPREIIDFYKTNAKIIFPQSRKTNLIKSALGIEKFDNKPLEDLLKKYLGNKRIQDSIVRLCIPSVDADTEEPTVFKTGHSDMYKRDPKLQMIDVALATSAAPTFFPKYNIKDLHRSFVDGGLSANNPSLIGIIEALNIFIGPDKLYNRFALLSVGNIDMNTGCFDRLQKGFFARLPFVINFINLLMRVQNKTTSNMAGLIAEATGSIYKRIANNDLTREQAKKFNLDSSDEDVINLLIAKGHSDAEHNFKDIIAKGFISTEQKTTLEVL